MDAADPDLEYADPVGQRLVEERLRHGGSDTVVCTQHVAEASDDGIHVGRVGVVAQSDHVALVERLRRYPVERYPVQHATTQFHLGSVLLHAGDTGAALEALTAARDAFAHAGLRLEQAKATVVLGVALRAAGRSDEAVAAFSTAGDELGALAQPAEQAAASYDLGLVLQDVGDLLGAHAAWTTARELFLSAGYPAQAAAAARDHGASLLTMGEVEAARPLLERATSLAERAGDDAGAGAAANVLGLAHLAAREPAAAVTALRRASSAFPRGSRPAEHAMVKANLALAHEQAGNQARARLAARQALAVPSAAGTVRTQAQQILARLPGQAHEDLLAVLDVEHREQWVGVIRDEVLRVAELPGDDRRALLGGFLDGVLARAGASYDLVESLLQVVLELPPRTYGSIVATVVDACAGRPERDGERLRAVISSALARFALPQWQRLVATLNAAATAAGQPATWR